MLEIANDRRRPNNRVSMVSGSDYLQDRGDIPTRFGVWNPELPESIQFRSVVCSGASSAVGSALVINAGVNMSDIGQAVCVVLSEVSVHYNRPVFIAYDMRDNEVFTQGFLLDSEQSEIQRLIARFGLSQVLSYGKVLSDKLANLLLYAKEEDPAGMGISLSSLQSFSIFMNRHSDFKCPALSLTPEGHIYASWKEGKRQVFSIHFLPHGDVRFVIFKPNEMHPDRQFRISGTATADSLIREVESHLSGQWVKQ